MPNRGEHVEHCKELYGYGFERIHEWMDGTNYIKGGRHREDRHEPFKTPKKAYKIFREKVPEEHREFIKDAVLDHITLDAKEKNQTGKPEGKKNLGEKNPGTFPGGRVLLVKILNPKMGRKFSMIADRLGVSQGELHSFFIQKMIEWVEEGVVEITKEETD